MKKIILIIGNILKESILEQRKLEIAQNHHLGARLIDIFNLYSFYIKQ